MNIEQLESYNLADAVKFHDRLNPLLWDSREHLHPEIHSQLIKIADDFRDSLGVNNLELKDITISGSNAAYSYTPHSDIDLHLIVDLSGVDHPEIYRELFDAKKAIYNGEHTITIKGIPVELYVQDAAQDHHSQGIYSIINNDWIQIPRRVQADIDDMSVRSKYADLSNRIDKVVKTEDLTKMNELAAKIKKMRQEGLAEHGEFGPENLVFKMLRNQGHIEQLRTARHEAKSKELSLKERVRKPKTIYGYGRDLVDEVAITPGGVSDHTKMFVEKDEEPANSQQEIIEDFIDFCSAQLGLAKEINLRIRRDPEWSVRNKTFGRYDQQTNELNVGVSGRHIMDILRTVAHELVHQRQNETQEMPPDAGADGSEYENEANAQAAVLMRRYGKLHPELFVPTELNEELEKPVTAHGYMYNRQDQRIAWTKEFASEAEAKEWARRRNATLLSVVPKQKLSEGTGQINWVKPNFDFEWHEVEEQSKMKQVPLEVRQYYQKHFPNKAAWLAAVQNGRAVVVPPDHSYEIRNAPHDKESLLKVLAPTSHEGAVGPAKKKRVNSLFAKGGPIEMPIVLKTSNGLWLIGGKTRLGTANYIKGIPAKVWMIDGDQDKAEELNEASGYIPTAAEANDPRYEMALTVDIRPGALGKAANAFLLNTDSQGHPQELRPDGLVNRMTVEYSKFKQ